MDFKSFFIPDYTSLQTDLYSAYLNYPADHTDSIVEYPIAPLQFGGAPYYESTIPFDPVIYQADVPSVSPIGIEVPHIPEFAEPKVHVRRKSQCKGIKQHKTTPKLTMPVKIRKRMEILTRMQSIMNKSQGGSTSLPHKELLAVGEQEPIYLDKLGPGFCEEQNTPTTTLAEILSRKLQVSENQDENDPYVNTDVAETIKTNIFNEPNGNDYFECI